LFVIIDLHAHTSKQPMRDLHVTSASIETLEGLASQYGITTIVLLATYFTYRNTGVHNYDMLERIKGHPLFLMFGSLDAKNELEAGLAELEQLATEEKISGIKLYPGYQRFHPSEPELDAVYTLAEKFRLPVMLHGGELHRCDEKYQELARPCYIEKPARDHPNVKFVVSHLSNPYFAELRDVMDRCPNVHTDISGQFRSGSPEDTPEYREFIVGEIRKFLSCSRGSERVIFATDFPIQSYKDTLDLVNRLNLSGQDLKNMMAENSLRILDKNYVPPRS
jgi:predicted TIM-barrel fold metal-dependent hydrolase